MNVSSWLKSDRFADLSRLDKELILANALQKERSFLHAHPDCELKDSELLLVNLNAERRQKAEPLAYILGQKEFYGRSFAVNKNVLIPRPETEDLVEIAKKYFATVEIEAPKILDLGTGSGCLAITLACELERLRPEITAADISNKALECAQSNAVRHHQESISFIKSNLFSNKSLKQQKFNLIVANLPYVDKAWPWLNRRGLKFEPKLALYASNHGLSLIKKLIISAASHLSEQGILVLEADLCQHEEIMEFAMRYAPDLQITEEYLPSVGQNCLESHQSLGLVLCHN